MFHNLFIKTLSHLTETCGGEVHERCDNDVSWRVDRGGGGGVVEPAQADRPGRGPGLRDEPQTTDDEFHGGHRFPVHVDLKHSRDGHDDSHR